MRGKPEKEVSGAAHYNSTTAVHHGYGAQIGSLDELLGSDSPRPPTFICHGLNVILVDRNPVWVEHVVAELGKNLPPIRKAFIYVMLAYFPENPEEDDRSALIRAVDRAIEDATRAFERAEDLSVKAE
jgi:hypothetical protein